MPANYVLLERVTLTSAAASVTFDNIPQTGYTDLKVVISGRSNRPTEIRDELLVRFNGDTGNNYNYKTLLGNGSSASSLNGSSASAIFRNDMPASGATANIFSNQEIYIPNYLENTQKSVSIDSTMENNATASWSHLTAGLWTGTAAITSITLIPETSTFTSNSTFSLYGVAAVGTEPTVVPLASGGDIVVNDGTYWYHTFLSSGVFIPNQGLTCDYLVVAGGGGGGGTYGGGGGAGGLRSTVTATGGGGSLESALSLTAQAYTVTVGAGGAGGAAAQNGVVGNNSVFSTITSTGGGDGAGDSGVNGTTGGSGGGGSLTKTRGLGTANQGFDGGAGSLISPYPQGGGGGAGEAGNTDGTSAGGDGVAVSISGSSVTYAGGGGSGQDFTYAAGGDGGGGAGNGTAGTVNTGGGGGGNGYNPPTPNAGGAGGSGIVIVRYTMA